MSDLEQAIAEYETAINCLTNPPEMTTETTEETPIETKVLNLLNARDRLQIALTQVPSISNDNLTKIQKLDSIIQETKNKNAIAPILTTLRPIFNPDTTAWWWFLESVQPESKLKKWNWFFKIASITNITVRPTSMSNSEIFISYAWKGDSEAIADALEKTFQQKDIKIIRDKTNLGYKGLIRKFMQQIGQGKFVIIVISDKYLKSKNCMFELLEIAKNGNFYNRIFPIVLPDANIYDAVERLQYVNYWDEKIENLNQAIKNVKEVTNLQGITEEINLYRDIRNKISQLTDTLQNMNTLTVDEHLNTDFNPIITAIEKQLNQENTRLEDVEKKKQ
ncbi:MAG: toll/interleukin-1 receptor domain-containing protein [Crocosphaera sp.]|nr:toll/interleukin-1 receptor domain-containing protein [Crocosphaera sp.]